MDLSNLVRDRVQYRCFSSRVQLGLCSLAELIAVVCSDLFLADSTP
jgi:hypothetical protein